MHSSAQNQSGLAITPILLAIVLLVAIAVAITASARNIGANNSEHQSRLIAMTLINQGNNLVNGFHLMESQGYSYDQTTIDETPGTGLYNPATGAMARQYVPIDALVSGHTDKTWAKGARANLNGVGSSAAEDLVVITYLTQAVCAEINRLLFQSPAIPDIPGSGSLMDDTTSSGDLTGLTPVGATTMCIHLAVDDTYGMYATVHDN